MNVIEITRDVTLNIESIGAIMRNPINDRAIVIVGGQQIEADMRYEDLKEFIKNASRIKTEAAY